MKILYVAMCAPYDKVSHAGGQTLNYYIKRMANQPDVKVDLVTYCSEELSHKLMIDLKDINTHLVVRHHNLKNILRDVLSINSKFNPFYKYCNLMTWNASELLLACLKSMKRQGYCPDIIVMEWTQIILQIYEIKKIFTNAKYIASEHDVTFLGVKRRAEYEINVLKKTYKRIQEKNTYNREISALNQCDLIVVHNDKDKKLLNDNGFNNERLFSLVPFYHQSKIQYKRSNSNIVFWGYMKRYENITAAKWFIDNVMPRIKDLPCRFIIIGGGVSEEIKSWENDKVVVTGYVPEVDEYFAHAMCFVSPLLLGAGIKVKILEAMYAGIPVLTNDIGIEGIPAQDEMDYYHCQIPEDYEQVIRALYESDPSQNIANGRNVIMNKFSLNESFRNYYSALIKLMETEK